MSLRLQHLGNRTTWIGAAGHLTLAAGAAALWELTHYFTGITRDGELYAMQALARLHPHLSADLYLANPSQDSLTLFTPLYAWLIGVLGLQAASTLLFFVCKILYLAAAWVLVWRWAGTRLAWISVGLLICVASNYGAFGIFEACSDYLTARSLGEALVIAALATFYRSRWLAAPVILLSFLVHPLMAFPGLLVLLFVSISTRRACCLTVVGVAGAALLALCCARGFVSSGFLLVIDPAWLEVVRERSQFLFLDYWKLPDWEMHLRLFASLALTYTAVSSERVRELIVAVSLVAVCGLLIALIAGSIGPVAIMLQGQAWRWTWIASLLAVMLLAPAAWQLWQRDRCGRLCAVLLLLGWTYPVVNGGWVVTSALMLLHLGDRVPKDRDRYMRWAAYLLLTLVGLWTIDAVIRPETNPAGNPIVGDRVMTWMRDALWVRTFSASLFALLVYSVTRQRSPPWLAGAMCAFLVIYAAPHAMLSRSGFQSLTEHPQFADWRRQIPDSSTVLLLPARYSSAFEWFTLERPGYLSLNQEAGVVFSPVTAAEVKRRAEVLIPVMAPSWKLLSQNRALARGERPGDMTRPLTAEALEKICADSALGFIVAQEDLGFGALRQTSPGRWQGWNLYDCGRVRAAGK